MGWVRSSHTTPGWVSTRTTGCACAAWKVRILAMAALMASLMSSSRRPQAASISVSLTRSCSRGARSKRRLSSRRASSPRLRTAAMISFTTAPISASSLRAGRVSTSACWAGERVFQIRVCMMSLPYSIIFSMGSTRMELAPRALSCSMVSQNRVSLDTTCRAT